MSFWSKIFSSGNNEEKSDSLNQNTVNVNQQEDHIDKQRSMPKTDTNPVLDKNGWYRLSSGILYKNDPNFNGTLNDIYARHISELGYNRGELYPKDNLNVDDMIIGYFTLFSNQLIAICRNANESTPIMTKYEISRFLSDYGSIFEWEEEGNIKDGINNHSISQGFVENITGTRAMNNTLSNGKYILSFEDGYLIDFKSADGYSSTARDYLNIDAYYENAKQWYNGNKDLIVAEINLHADCFSNTDLSIIKSNETLMRFAYPNGYANYIAVAAHFNVCDILYNDFINSTHGNYEVVSIDTEKGIRTTKVRAYGYVFTFIDGHSMPKNISNKNISLNLDDELDVDGNGFVYVMINPSMPDMVKIGQTKKDPNERAKELSSSTGVPTPFIVVFYKPFENCVTAEKVIHAFLQEQGYRVSDNREFFYVPVNEAINVVQAYYNIETQESIFD